MTGTEKIKTRVKPKEPRQKTSGVYGRSMNMQRKLALYLFSLFAVIFSVILIIMSIAGVLPGTAVKTGEMLSAKQDTAVQQVRQTADELAARGVRLSTEVSNVLDRALASSGKPFEELNDNPQLIARVEAELLPCVKSVPDANLCSGAFVILDATVNTAAKNAENSRMSVYLRFTDLQSVSAGNQNIAYFRGAKDVARQIQMPMHNQWELEYDISKLPGYNYIMRNARANPADSLYWQEAVPVEGTWERAMLLLVPVNDASGRTRGVCALELTEQFYRLSTPVFECPAGDIVTVLAPIEGRRVLLNKALVGGAGASYLTAKDELTIKKGKHFNAYISALKESEVFLGRHAELDVKTASGRPLAVCSFISRNEYESYASARRVCWIFGMTGVFILTLALCVYSSRRFARPIVRKLRSMESESLQDEVCSGISEIDSLYAFLKEERSRSADEPPPNIKELMDDFEEHVRQLTPMEHCVLYYFINGHSVADVAKYECISLNTVRKHKTNIYRKLNVGSWETLLLYIDLFRRFDLLDRIS